MLFSASTQNGKCSDPRNPFKSFPLMKQQQEEHPCSSNKVDNVPNNHHQVFYGQRTLSFWEEDVNDNDYDNITKTKLFELLDYVCAAHGKSSGNDENKNKCIMTADMGQTIGVVSSLPHNKYLYTLTETEEEEQDETELFIDDHEDDEIVVLCEQAKGMTQKLQDSPQSIQEKVLTNKEVQDDENLGSRASATDNSEFYSNSTGQQAVFSYEPQIFHKAEKVVTKEGPPAELQRVPSRKLLHLLPDKECDNGRRCWHNDASFTSGILTLETALMDDDDNNDAADREGIETVITTKSSSSCIVNSIGIQEITCFATSTCSPKSVMDVALLPVDFQLKHENISHKQVQYEESRNDEEDEGPVRRTIRRMRDVERENTPDNITSSLLLRMSSLTFVPSSDLDSFAYQNDNDDKDNCSIVDETLLPLHQDEVIGQVHNVVFDAISNTSTNDDEFIVVPQLVVSNDDADDPYILQQMLMGGMMNEEETTTTVEDDIESSITTNVSSILTSLPTIERSNQNLSIDGGSCVVDCRCRRASMVELNCCSQNIRPTSNYEMNDKHLNNKEKLQDINTILANKCWTAADDCWNNAKIGAKAQGYHHKYAAFTARRNTIHIVMAA